MRSRTRLFMTALLALQLIGGAAQAVTIEEGSSCALLYFKACEGRGYSASAGSYAQSDYAFSGAWNPYAYGDLHYNGTSASYGWSACEDAAATYFDGLRGKSPNLGDAWTWSNWGVTAAQTSYNYCAQKGVYNPGASGAVSMASGARSNFSEALTYQDRCYNDMYYRNSEVSYTYVPTTVTRGQYFTASILIKNTGAYTWTAYNGYVLGSVYPANNTTWGTGRIALPLSVPTGGYVKFDFTVRAPSTPGTYNFQWRMLQENVVWFGAFTDGIKITVQ